MLLKNNPLICCERKSASMYQYRWLIQTTNFYRCIYEYFTACISNVWVLPQCEKSFLKW